MRLKSFNLFISLIFLFCGLVAQPKALDPHADSAFESSLQLIRPVQINHSSPVAEHDLKQSLLWLISPLLTFTQQSYATVFSNQKYRLVQKQYWISKQSLARAPPTSI